MPDLLSRLFKKSKLYIDILGQIREMNEKLDDISVKLSQEQNNNKKLTAENYNLNQKLDILQREYKKENSLLKKEITSLQNEEQILDNWNEQNLSAQKQVLDTQGEIERQLLNNKKQLLSLQREDEGLKAKINDVRNNLSKDIEYYYYKGLHPDQYAENLKEWYSQRMGRKLDLDHPKTFTEKIQWLKLYDSTNLKGRLSDKYAVREWVAERVGEKYLVPLLGVYDCFDDIDFDQLPDRFVIKTNHACGTNWIVTDKVNFKRSEARAFFNTWMRRNFAFWYGLELQYKNIEPKILIEEYLENSENNLDDYKVFCFDGTARCVMFLTDRKKGLKQAFYDREWSPMPCTYNFPHYDQPVEKPDNLDELLSVAENLSKGFYHVRVDFYRLNSGEFKFSEMTFTTSSGMCKWCPEEYDRIFGDYIKLPTDK